MLFCLPLFSFCFHSVNLTIVAVDWKLIAVHFKIALWA